MHGRTIAQIYFYLISAASIALIVLGIHSTVTFVLNSTQYDKYPLQYFGEDCENFRYPVKGPYPAEVTPEASLSGEERQRLRENCENRVELERKQHKLNDIRNAIVFTLVGLILFAIHFPQARKMSKS